MSLMIYPLGYHSMYLVDALDYWTVPFMFVPAFPFNFAPAVPS